MFAIIVTEKGGEQRRLEFDKAEVTIGRVQGNDVILPKGNVSKRHARIVLKDGKFIIVDLKSTNGTYVNGRKITSPLVVKESDKIYIGDFILGVEEGRGAGAEPEAAEAPQWRAPEPAPPAAMPPAPPPRAARPPPAPLGAPPPPGMGGPAAPPPVPPRLEPLADGGQAAAGRPTMQRAAVSPPPGLVDDMGPPPAITPQRNTLPPPPAVARPRPPAAPSMSAAPPPPNPGHGAAMHAPPTPLPQPPPPVPAPLPMAQAHMPHMPPMPMGQGGPDGRDGRQEMRPAGAPMMPAGPPMPPPHAPPPMPAPSPPLAPPPMTPPSAAASATSQSAEHRAAASAAARAQRAAATGSSTSRSPAPAAARRAPPVEPLDPKQLKMLDLQREIQERLAAKLDLGKVPVERLGDEDLWQRAEGAIVDLVETLDSSGAIPGFVDQDALIKESLNEALGLGPLEDLLADPQVEEILVDRRDRILVGKGGGLFPTGKAFSSDATFRRVVERLVAPTGRTVDEGSPLIDVRLRDGTRLTAAVPPVAVRGACLTLHKPRTVSYVLPDLVGAGTLSPAMADFLATCVVARRNLLVCGASGAGKSAVLSALAAAAPEGERIVTVEEVAELALGRDSWIALEARPSDGNGVRSIDIGSVLRSALRLRPDRLVVGDLRGGEALDLIAAMAAACDGTLVAIAGEGPGAALSRLTALAHMAAPGASIEGLRELAACAVHVVVHVARYADGAHRVASISEVVGVGEHGFATRELFSFRGGSGEGGFTAAGVVPAFYAELEARGIPADTSIFR